MGKPKYIETPEKFWEYFEAYQEHIKQNPIKKQDFVGKDALEVNRKLERPLTWVGFENYLYKAGIISDLSDYEENKNNSYTDYLPIIRVIKRIIEQDQFEGATVGIYQQNIIARKLGLVDKKEVERTVITVKTSED
jgi:hypothetical protein